VSRILAYTTILFIFIFIVKSFIRQVLEIFAHGNVESVGAIIIIAPNLTKLSWHNLQQYFVIINVSEMVFNLKNIIHNLSSNFN
jgi:hypothetical protein